MLDATFFDTHFLSRLFLKAFAPYLHYMKVEALNGEEQSEQREQQRNRLVEDLKQCGKPLCYFPEGWDTNGKGLLVYQRYMFSVVEHIVPCALRVSVPFAPIRPGMLGSSIFREIMWLLFSPCYSYHMCILPAIHRGKDSPTEFANRCQRLTALALGIPATPYSKKDALTYRRTLLHPKQD